MSCLCNCNNVIRISSITSTDTEYLLVAENFPTLVNGGRYVVVIPNDLIESTTEILPVVISFDSVNYQIMDRCIGNDVYSDQIRFINQNCCNKVFRAVFGTSPDHFKIISQYLPQSMATPNN